METRSITVQRTARYHVLGDPGADWDELWFVLHGYGQLARRFLAEFESVARPGRLIVAPEGLSRFYLRDTRGRVGASWMTSDDREREIADYVSYLDALRAELAPPVKGRPSRTEGVLGFSQGTATAGRWAVLGERSPDRLVLWGGGFPHDLDPERVRSALPAVRVELVVGANDEHIPAESVREEAAALSQLGASPRVLGFEGGHHLDGPTLRSLFAEERSTLE